jgi:serine/threonine protein kinase
VPTPAATDSSATPAVAVAALPRRTPPYEMGRYRLLRQLGEGGMAEVYIAEAHGAEGFKRHFVVKRLHPHLANRKEVVTQFIDEARLQARLLHSNIVPVFDFGRAGEEYFLALEYVHGRDLEKLVLRHQQLTGARPAAVDRRLRAARGAGGAVLRPRPHRHQR